MRYISKRLQLDDFSYDSLMAMISQRVNAAPTRPSKHRPSEGQPLLSQSSLPLVIDRKLLASRRRRALERKVDGADFLLATVTEDLADRLSATLRHFSVAVDLSGFGDLMPGLLRQAKNVDRVFRFDPLVADCDKALPHAVIDEENLPLAPQSCDLITSTLALQFVNDLPGTFIQIKRALKPDGLFLGAMLGGETLGELRQAMVAAEVELNNGASPRVAPFADVRDIGALLQRAGFALPVVDQDRLTVRYDSVWALFRDLRAMGATNVLVERDGSSLSRALIERIQDIYAERYSDPDGRLRATFQVISLSGWIPHESQQKPLQPGSANASLADAIEAMDLGTHAFDAGSNARSRP